MPKKYFAIVPARGGSKGIPNKNISLLGGKTLLEHTFNVISSNPLIYDHILSTDSGEIADIGKNLGMNVPFLRPPELASDHSTAIEVCRHIDLWCEQEYDENIDAYIYLQPTSPLRTEKQVEEAIYLFEKEDPDTLVSVTEVPHSFLSFSQYRMFKNQLERVTVGEEGYDRFKKERLWARNGPAILIFKKHQLKKESFYNGEVIGFKMDRTTSLDIDEPLDLKIAELFLKELV